MYGDAAVFGSAAAAPPSTAAFGFARRVSPQKPNKPKPASAKPSKPRAAVHIRPATAGAGAGAGAGAEGRATGKSSGASNFTATGQRKICGSCGTKSTPYWRDGWDGVCLCNACGIRCVPTAFSSSSPPPPSTSLVLCELTAVCVCADCCLCSCVVLHNAATKSAECAAPRARTFQRRTSAHFKPARSAIAACLKRINTNALHQPATDQPTYRPPTPPHPPHLSLGLALLYIPVFSRTCVSAFVRFSYF